MRNYGAAANFIKMSAVEGSIYERVSKTKNGRPKKDFIRLHERIFLPDTIDSAIGYLEDLKKEGYSSIRMYEVYSEWAGEDGHMIFVEGSRPLKPEEMEVVDSIQKKFDAYFEREKVKEREKLEKELASIREKLEKLNS